MNCIVGSAEPDPPFAPGAHDMTEDTIRARDVLLGLRHLRRGLGNSARALRLLALSSRDSYLSIGHMLEENASRHGSRPALLFENAGWTYAQFNEQANRYAHALHAAGIRKGDVVAVFMENRPDTLFVVSALVKLGAIAGMINTAQRGDVLLHSLGLCQPAGCVVGAELADAYRQVAGELQVPAERTWAVPEDGVAIAGDGFADLQEQSRHMDAGNPETTGEVRMQDAAFYIFTSGTTGLPKASVMSHFRWVKAMAGTGLIALDMQQDDVLYCALPLYHNNALTVCWGAAMSNGSALALARKFSASRFWDDIRRHDASAFCYIGELCRYLMAQPVSPLDREHRVTRMMGNGLRPDIWKPFKERFGVDRVLEFYGASECNIGFLNIFNFDGTVGFCPAPYAIVAYDVDKDAPVRDARGRLQRVRTGEVGLLLGEISDLAPYDGYTDPEASEKKLLRGVFRKGDCWFNTGDLMRDLGWRHAQFVDRLGDTFRWKGENVSTAEVEEVLNQHPQIEQAAVYGVQVPGTDGRAGMASLVCSVPHGQFDFDSLQEIMQDRLPRYAHPVFLRFSAAHDVTGTFKLKKTVLKEEGFDPQQVSDPVYVLLPGSRSWQILDAGSLHALNAGEIRL